MKLDMNGTWNTLWLIIFIEAVICLLGIVNNANYAIMASAILIVGTLIIGSILAYMTEKDRKANKNTGSLN